MTGARQAMAISGSDFNRNDGDLFYICGSSRNGKTAYTKQLIMEFVRVLVWDIEGEFGRLPGFKIIRKPKELLDTLQKTKGPGKIVYQGSLRDYSFFCKCALAWGDQSPCAVVLEETSDVTSPGKAPDGHGQLIRKGLKRGINIFAITQRPAESDKTTIGNATFIITFYLTRADDQKYVAREMNITQDKIETLRKLEFMKKDVVNRKVTKGKLQFQG